MTEQKKPSRAFHLLVVDDDSLIHQSIRLLLPTHWKLTSAKEMSDIPFDRFFHAAMVDMHLTPHSKNPVGLEVIRRLTEKMSNLEVIAMSGDFSRELMESCLKLGAQRFLSKPLMGEEILLLLDKIEALWSLRNVETQLKNSQTRWVGKSEAAQDITRKIAGLRGERKPVLVEGETGTGKEVVSRLLNQQEGEQPFITVNVAGLPENLFESEMFGHVKGAFTGADQNKIGLCEAAHGGDLFLDEVEALSLSHQAKLLRFFESGEVRRVGAKESVQIQCRVIVASNRPLEKMVKENTFREDLYFRICSHRIELPPLRERPEDIPELAQYFLSLEKPRRNKSFTEDGLEALKQYPWPGNVRELRRVCEQLSLTSPLPLIRREDVNTLLRPALNFSSQESYDVTKGLSPLVEEFEARVIVQCLKANSDIEKTADILKISRSSLYKKIKDYRIDEAMK
jgi:DNA-binding NtrC family response regulator